MGLLSLGKPLSWEETKKHAEHVRKHGIIQFINLYHQLKDRQDECLRWGDEVEYMIIKFEDEKEKVKVSLKAAEILKIMSEREEREGDKRASLWRPEFAAYMIEGTPGSPYGLVSNHSAILSHFNTVEENMRLRRHEVEQLLAKDEALLCLTSFPRLGCPGFCHPPAEPDPIHSATGSLFYPDDAIFGGHPRFKTLAQNIRTRRKRKVIINIPIFRDINTPDPFREHFNDEEAEASSRADHIYMDAMGFGMGCCCLQVTFQASNLEEARILYDQLTPLSPILMALSAASPIHRGYLSDRDCRWSVISQAVDDRTKEELGEEPLKNSKYRINKSRYDSIDSYISEAGSKYNDIQLIYNEEYYDQMIKEGIDPFLAKHVAHLFIRDPIIVYKEKLDQNDETESDHFENIQSTNWQTMRFKPPPPQSSIGWRVEFRPMEVQFTEFENAAYVVFIVLLTRLILTYRLNFLIPISKVDENMQEAQKRDAVLRCRYWFRKDIITQTSPPEACACVEATGCPSESNICDSENVNLDESCILMSVNEIINGKGSHFPGLVPLLRQYLVSIEIDAETHCTIQQYLNLIANRASGNVMTNAAWIRKYVREHEQYNKDSVVSDKIAYDLIKVINGITKGEIFCKELVGDSPFTRDRILRRPK
ncbi:glutamate--cysteine ligase catalytic subunit-like protein [Dinothrombium tinctorium]|uniref:Glutamate--cysteine ligase n=1 Tax=Dinothrombium tinctorium TaxID=1965070 RepID=A0A3S3P0W4_9ACAR|nr:glutamate--cysteine ligase catalytic subunit-like protein [Dinothrombium tinctorium]